MSRVGIFGGSFDPIHNGHLITAMHVKEVRNLDKIIFIPCHISPHKLAGGHSLPDDRLNIVKSAVSGITGFEVSDFELRKGAVSYSIDTIKHFKKKYDEIDLIIGYDNLLVFESWKSPDEITQLVNLVVLKRKTESEEKSNRFFKFAHFVDTPIIEISSTEIRKRISQNKPVNFLIPEKVLNYITKKNLYRF